MDPSPPCRHTPDEPPAKATGWGSLQESRQVRHVVTSARPSTVVLVVTATGPWLRASRFPAAACRAATAGRHVPRAQGCYAFGFCLAATQGHPSGWHVAARLLSQGMPLMQRVGDGAMTVLCLLIVLPKGGSQSGALPAAAGSAALAYHSGNVWPD